MLHASISQPPTKRTIFSRRRFQLAGALVFAAVLPFVARLLISGNEFELSATSNALIGNAMAVLLAFWMRLSIETYPGIRASYVILPTAATGHAIIVAMFLLSRLPYDRIGLTLGFLLHVVWYYAVYFSVQRHARLRIAIIPFGDVEALTTIDRVFWSTLSEPRLDEANHYDAIVADFSADLPDEWEGFLADAALAGKIVYQVKQLSESLTGRVELDHLSENSFGSLLPARGYFHLKELLDFALAVVMLPFAIPVMAVAAIAIRAESRGPVFFRQDRIGHAGKRITVLKFRTMRPFAIEDITDHRAAAITDHKDDRITRVGSFLRRSRLDELPQIWNILRGQMSWIGPRPEAEVLSHWYVSELPFYRYRHVVKPGISGWAQVNQGHVAGVDEVNRKLSYDFYYIKYFSPWLDLLILVRTIKTMLSGFGSR
jgi:lipopolysaccharide/colanic/teichoic acid biosynthesis glycosyltransferase